MASVTNLDSDVNSKRGDRVTPAAVDEVRNFIEQSLGESLPDVGDDPKFGTYNILAALKDGVALCKYVHLLMINLTLQLLTHSQTRSLD